MHLHVRYSCNNQYHYFASDNIGWNKGVLLELVSPKNGFLIGGEGKAAEITYRTFTIPRQIFWFKNGRELTGSSFG